MDVPRKSEPTGSETSPGQPSSSDTRKKRCASGCLVCRARKVKCDERPGGCSNCERLQLKCPGNAQEVLPPVDDLKLPPKAGTKRKKTYRSCKECRVSKTRCSGDRPRCTRCARKSLECVFDASSEPQWARNISNYSDPPYSGPDGSEPQSHRPQDFQTPAANFDDPQAAEISAPSTDTSPYVGSESFEWLYLTRLPSEKDKIRLLLEEYFANIHPLRSFGFLHKPSFMQRFDEGLPAGHTGNALLYAVCALGAKFHALLHHGFSRRLSRPEVLAAGDKWARESSRLIFADLDTISVENLMAAVLLHDHELRVGRFASAFMLSGVSARMAQALQVNLEYSADVLCAQPGDGPSPVLREARRRLMWSCYVMDAWVGSGVDQLTILDDADIKVQLPCSERLFLHQKLAITETLVPGRILPFLPNDAVNNEPKENMGMAAYLADNACRYVKHLDTAQPPWLPESEFSELDRCLRTWYETLPMTLQFTTNSQYTRQESSQLGALVHLHCTYHSATLDLYRIGMPRLFKIRQQFHFPPERLGFLTSTQQTCFCHAKQVAIILQTAARHGVKTLADTWLAVIAHDTNRVMLYYLTKIIDPTAISNHALVNETLPLIRSNLLILRMMAPLFSMSNSLYDASANMLRQSGLDTQADEILANFDNRAAVEGPTAPNTPVQSTTENASPEFVLNPLAIYRLARKSVPEKEKHQPELHPSPGLNQMPTDQSSDTNWYQPEIQYHHQGQQYPRRMTVSNDIPFSGVAPQVRTKGGMDDLEMFFSTNFDLAWQPADTILEQGGGIAPWQSQMHTAPGAGNGEIDMFMPIYPWGDLASGNAGRME